MLFRKSRKSKEVRQERTDFKSKVATKLGAYLVAVQTAFGSFMGKWINGLTLKGRKAFLIIFCIVFGSYSLYIILSVFFSDNTSTANSIRPKEITIPRHLNKSGDENTSPSNRSEDNEVQKIKRFTHYLDSLKLSTSGRRIYDSIITSRPGLIDSIKVLEQFYNIK